MTSVLHIHAIEALDLSGTIWDNTIFLLPVSTTQMYRALQQSSRQQVLADAQAWSGVHMHWFSMSMVLILVFYVHR